MDILDQMTKAEIIEWVRSQAFLSRHLPTKSHLLFCRWEKMVHRLSEENKANIAFGETLNMAKRDELAKQFNSETDVKKRIKIMEKMAPYEKKFERYISYSKILHQENKKADDLYAQYEKQLEKERNAEAV